MKSLSFAMLALVAACHAPIGLDKQENTYSAVEGGFELSVVKNDVQLTEIEVENAHSTRVGGLLRLEFDLVNTANHRVPLEWRLHWYTAGGTEVDFQNPWNPTVLDVHERRAIQKTAPLPACVGWKLSTRSPHTSN